MLKHLDLIGFKSFADKTRLELAPGITAVVGPNGSGKSNVVDAVRWILGEQSAKTLRGGEMADVIFTGSASRKGLGLAEVGVTFDNARRLLAFDADEVRVVRRVYRDGTGEYLLNGQPARLKDVRDVFLGTGAGAGGYTVIGQGRVDELLAASPKDRRDIFDEAAGVSRFKTRKAEALRKLAAVEANLGQSRTRLDGLDARVRALRLQATKAKQHKEHSDRLRDLRVGVGAREYRERTAALDAELAALADLQAAAGGATARAGELERLVRQADGEVSRADEAARLADAELTAVRQRAAGLDAGIRHDRATAAGHEAEWLRAGKGRAGVALRVRELDAELARAGAEAATAEDGLRAAQSAADAAAADLAAAVGRAADLAREAEADQQRQYDLVHRAGEAKSQAAASLADVERLQGQYTRKLSEIDRTAARAAGLATALDGLSRAGADVQARLTAARGRLADRLAERDALAAEAEAAGRRLEELRVRRGDLGGRVEVLEGLEQAQDGLAAGVRSLLARSSEFGVRSEGLRGVAGSGSDSALRTPRSALSEIAGLVADLLTVPRDIAPLVELALGDAAQRFVVRDPAAVDAVAAAAAGLPGRVGFVPLTRTPPPNPLPDAGRGDQTEPPSSSPSPLRGGGWGVGSDWLSHRVRCDHPGLAGLPDQLLGDVLLADDLADARRAAASHPGCRVVTRAGDLLEPDGTLSVGPAVGGAGLVSRKSELRELRGQSAALAAAVAAAEGELAALRRRADAVAGEIAAAEAEAELLSGEAGDLLQAIARQRQQVEQLEEMVGVMRGEAKGLADDVRRGEAAWVAARLDAEEAERAADGLRERVAAATAAMRAAEADRDRCQRADADTRVAAGRAAADRDRARDRRAAVEAEHRRRRLEHADQAAAAHNARVRLADVELALLRAAAEAAEAYRQKDERERRAADLGAAAAAARAARDRARADLDAVRAGWHDRQAAAHARELAAHDLRNKREAVAARIREDYGVDLASLDQESGVGGQDSGGAGQPRPEVSPAEAQAEIDDLKKKLARLGGVDPEAVAALAAAEAELAGLTAQHDDLAAARKSLAEVIETINADSRRLFADTLAAVRGHFQELFRKLFGGGQADVVLEPGADVLEAGVEVTARPPGKELRSLVLLSGGEKTMTAIALLLALFRNKPSPFCLLDEVDAALDEANTARLAGVLREFADRTQFIVVTHKKRTMAAADRLWGVTMAEGGVSRLLPMRFEDWCDPADKAAA